MPTNKEFFDKIREHFGAFSQKQVDGINTIVDTCEVVGVKDYRMIAYMLATAWHETDETMQPIEEYGKGKGMDYGKKLKMGGGKGQRIPYETPDKLYYGRGYVQLTWYENYQAFSKILGVDLLNRPELALQPDIAAKIMYKGMLNGNFTGKRLSDYFTSITEDPINARRIINGVDAADKISGHYHAFYNAFLTIK